ncbi:MAG: universal stress protein [Devosiaceae bacterium]|nr:universal stress protein [Devosiaceae bacterium]
MSKNYMLALDLGESSGSNKRAIEIAENLAKNDGATLHVVTVIPTFSMPIVGSYFPEGFEEKNFKLAKENLKKVIEEDASDPSAIKRHVVQGSIYEKIMSAADKLGCSLIIMEAHRPDLKDYLLGPNAARVVRHAKQSVYVIRDID